MQPAAWQLTNTMYTKSANINSMFVGSLWNLDHLLDDLWDTTSSKFLNKLHRSYGVGLYVNDVHKKLTQCLQ